MPARDRVGKDATAEAPSTTEQRELALAAGSTGAIAIEKGKGGGGSAGKRRPEEPLVAQPIEVFEREQEFFIPVHGEVRLWKREVAVVDHPAFQRLGEIFQLGQTFDVYRGSTHMRLEHSLGALHVAQVMIDALTRSCAGTYRPQDRIGDWNLGPKLREEEVAFTRLGALLHDIGHLPAGHTLEDEIGLITAHDGDERLALVLNRVTWHGIEYKPTLREIIDTRFEKLALQTGLKEGDRNLSASEILALLISKDRAAYKVPEGCQFRLAVCRDIIGNTICADLLDYLHRDFHHLGKRKEFDQRLLGYMEIRSRVDKPTDNRLVINFRGGNHVRTDAATLILDLLESRYQLSEIALFHKTKVCASAMLERGIAELAFAAADLGHDVLESLPELLLDCSDVEMLMLFRSLAAETAARMAAGPDRDRLVAARELFGKLRHRQLHKEFVASPEFKLADNALAIQNRYTGAPVDPDKKGAEKAAATMANAKAGAAHRLAAVRQLESDFAMRPGSLVMYCPPRKMNTKIAEVQVLVHGDVHTLDSFEGDNGDHGVTGGHLKAQKERFRRLWRVVFAIDPVERARLDDLHLLEPLGRAINLCVLRLPPAHSSGTIDHAVWSLARELTTREGSPLFKATPVEEGTVAARGGAVTTYPGGAPSLLSCVTR